MTSPYFHERAACPGCGSESRRELYACDFASAPIHDFLDEFYAGVGGIEHEYLAGARFVLDECGACTLVYQRQILTPNMLVKLYEEWIDPELAGASHRTTRDQAFAHARDVMTLLHHFGGAPHEVRLLDFGMGWGAFCLMAKAFGLDVSGAELSETRIAAAHANGIRVVDWDTIGRERFDFIHTEQVFEHLACPLDTLRHLASALSPRGLLKISVPDGHGIESRLARGNWNAPKGSPDSLNAVSPLEHVNCFTEKAMLAMAHRAGLRRATFTVGAQYAATIGVTPGRSLVRSLVRPFYKNHLGRSTNLLFERA